MKRTKIADRNLPDYTRGEEIFNMVTHIVGGAFGICALIACIIVAAVHRDGFAIVSGAIYGVSMILVYTISSIYHGLIPETAKKVFQILDHCDIYLLIAGTYTPILLTGIRIYDPVLCWCIFAFVWLGSAVGITFTAIDFHKYRVLSYAGYFVIGWSIVFAVKALIDDYPRAFFVWILAGGVAYTSGMIFYVTGIKKRYYHSIFHIFIIAGSVIQFVGVIMYCM